MPKWNPLLTFTAAQVASGIALFSRVLLSWLCAAGVHCIGASSSRDIAVYGREMRPFLEQIHHVKQCMK